MKSLEDIIKQIKKNLKPHEIKALNEIQNRSLKFTRWEKHVMFKLQTSKIEFEKKFRNFPLEIDGQTINYTPDFVLDFPYENRIRIIVEVHEDLTDFDVKKYRTFMDVYGRVYWLIMLVKDGELRKWNSYDNAEQALFHDIWTLNDVKHLISRLEKFRIVAKKKYESEKAECPKCKKRAEGSFEIDSLFGYRYDRTRPQSHCRVCRSNKNVDMDVDPIQFEKPKKVICPACGKYFLEKIRGQSFCEPCLKQFNN